MSTNIKIEKTNIEDIYGLTSLQEGMLYYYLKSKEEKAYFVQLSLDIIGSVDIDLLSKAWQHVVETNEVLRTIFRWENISKSIQIVLKKSKCDILFVDLSFHDSNYRNQEFEKVLIKDYEESVKLDENPIKLTLCKIGESNFKLIISNHHILYDGWSNGLIISELINNYEALIRGEIIKQISKTRFKEFIKINNLKSSIELNYWKNYLNDYSDFKTIQTKNSILNANTNEIIKISIGEESKQLLKNICDNNNVTIADILYTSWGILLNRYSGKNDILFGTTISGRNVKLKGIENMVGLFINTIPLRLNILSNQSILDVINEISAKIREREKYENVPLQSILEVSGLKGEDIFESIFVIENYPISKTSLSDNFVINSYSIRESTNYKLTISVLLGEKIEICFKYSPRNFERILIENISKHFLKIVDYIINSNDTIIEDLNVLSDSEKKQLLFEFNNTNSEYPREKTLYQLFDDNAARFPDRVAVVYNDCYLTFKDLKAKSNQVAKLLGTYGFQKNCCIGLAVDRSVEMIIGILGISKSGGAYLPIDPTYPQKRIEYIKKDASIDITLTQSKFQNKVEGIEHKIYLDSPSIFAGEQTGVAIDAEKGEYAYIIYTSGSTGEPKGVLVGHKGVVNLIYSIDKDVYSLKPEVQNVSLVSPIFFDASVKQIFPSLALGQCLIIVPEELRTEAKGLLEYYARNNVNVVDGTPMHLQMMLQFRDELEKLKSVRNFLIGGEELKLEIINELFNSLKGINFNILNVYGPTEGTDITSIFKYSRENIGDYESVVTVGKPISNVQTLILDSHFRPQPLGVFGELCVSGDNLSYGYLNNPELTFKKFVENPFEKGGKMFRTADLARWLPDGNIELLGRIDNQVKIRGYRIELGEIENVLIKNSEVKSCVVSVYQNNVDKYLCAYIVASKGFDVDNLRNNLIGQLPEYMIPTYFVRLDELPLTNNGKVNRRALPSPEIVAGNNYVAPSNDIEVRLANIWSEILNIPYESISVNANFFHIGGHSLKAMALTSKINKEFNVKIKLSEIFSQPTLKGVADTIHRTHREVYKIIHKVEKKEYYNLSSAQKRIFVIQKMNGSTNIFNIHAAFKLEGKLNIDILEESLKSIIKRHEALRTSFVIADGNPVQRIHDFVDFKIEYDNIQNEDKINHRVVDFIKPFDFSKPPLLRVLLIKMEDEKFILVVDIHHIISDGVTSEIIANEWLKLYEGSNIAEPIFQYKDFSEWQNSKYYKELIKKQEDFWLNEYKILPPLIDLPLDYKRGEVNKYQGNFIEWTINKEVTKKINNLIVKSEATMFTVLLSVYYVLVYKYTNIKDIVIGFPVTGRNENSFNNTLGMFVNMLAIRNRIDGNWKYLVFLEAVKKRVLNALENQEYPFDELVNRLGLTGAVDRNPLFNIVLALQNMDKSARKNSSFELTPYNILNTSAKFDLTLSVTEQGEELQMYLEYSTQLFNKARIEQFQIHFTEILTQVIEADVIIDEIQFSGILPKIKTKDIAVDTVDFNF
ncbi:MAG: amino acid adenylation domain-containing protein [Bacteroidales bacterium]|nr:amino acid adenylation domain-containing protein [Bacteroidales bacterium]